MHTKFPTIHDESQDVYKRQMLYMPHNHYNEPHVQTVHYQNVSSTHVYKHGAVFVLLSGLYNPLLYKEVVETPSVYRCV